MRGTARMLITGLAACAGIASAGNPIAFRDATDRVGLGGLRAARVILTDLNGDGRPDAIIDRHRVFLNLPHSRADAPAESAGTGDLRFEEVVDTGLIEPAPRDTVVFADMTNDGVPDAMLLRSLDVNADGFTPPENGPARHAVFPGRGDGTFGEPVVIDSATPATTSAVAVGDINRDGRLDLYLGNWYTRYGQSLEGFRNDVLLQRPNGTFARTSTDEDRFEFDEEQDRGGRPTYGAMILTPPHAERGRHQQILELNYGRRWNRLWVFGRDEDLGIGMPVFHDRAPVLGLDGDAIRHGRHPAWLAERARTDPRFARDDELPFRANGNSFDAALGDIDNDGDFDLLITEITHGWAGESSDRTRILLRGDDGRFTPDPVRSLDRVPTDLSIRGWNQGDLFAEMVDLNHDGRLDVVLSSGDYADDQRLRVYRQLDDWRLVDVTPWSGLANEGSQQFSLADVDLDGDLDLLVGQTFNRLPAARRAGRTPTVKLYLNRASERGGANSLIIALDGRDDAGINSDALGAVVRVTAVIGGERVTQVRQLIGIGGHAGKQHDAVVHVGLGDATQAERVEIEWPDREGRATVVDSVDAGRVRITPAGLARE